MMQLDDIKRHLQDHLSDGLVLVVGSGLSCAEGLPGMSDLAKHLSTKLGQRISEEDKSLWQEIAPLLEEEGLESALLKKPPTATLEDAIVSMTGAWIAKKEQEVIVEVFTGKRELRLTKLIRQLLKPSSGLQIITTNYDRLVEVAVEETGLGADTMFTGRYFGTLNEKESQMSFCRGFSKTKKSIRLEYERRAIICKPHGSLDWYKRNNVPVSYAGDLHDLPRLIITPGHNKFRNGYERPFDLHLQTANKIIDRAEKFLIIGYGFNDEHLETHLTPAIKSGKPTHMFAHTLTSNAKKMAMKYSNITALEHSEEGGLNGTLLTYDRKQQFLPNLGIWDIHQFVEEVLEP